MDKTSHGRGSGCSSNSFQTSYYWSMLQNAAGDRDNIPNTLPYPGFSISNSGGAMAGAEHTGNPLLTLGLGCSPSSSDISKLSSGILCATSCLLKDADEESSVDLGLNLGFYSGNGIAHCQQKSHRDVLLADSPKLDLQLSLCTGSPESVIIDAKLMSPDDLEIPAMNLSPATIGEGSVTHNLAFQCSIVSSSQASEETHAFSFPEGASKCNIYMPSPVISSTMFNACVNSPVMCTSEATNPRQRNGNTKSCQFPGCMKGARGASGRCIGHGGGRRCQKPGCQKGAEGSTIYCKGHGGGRRCQFLGCTKSAEGRTDHCIAHGGGRRCSHEGCSRAARGKSGLCIKHGGGKRCKQEHCTKSAEGHSGLCIAHGGGRRCQFLDCTKGAQGSTKFCKAHGGGKRCTFLGCTRGAEGSTAFCKGHGGGKRCSFQGGGVCPKSVHGGTQFCVAHGGGKRCASSGCTKSARGRTEYCVRHGGGKRCKFEGCSKSAQGSTDFCKMHGVGKRCSWGQVDSSFGAGAQQCDRFTRSKTALCSVHSALIQDRCVHGGGTLGPAVDHFVTDFIPEQMKVVAVKEDPHKKTSSNDKCLLDMDNSVRNGVVQPPVRTHFMADPLTEGRVHGGGLLAFIDSVEANKSGHKGVDTEALFKKS